MRVVLVCVLWAALVGLAQARRGGDCPKKCFCNTVSRIVYCSRRGLTSIPTDIPQNTKQLNLNGNEFSARSLSRANLSGLPLLEHLYLSDCGLRSVDVGAFRDLPQLQWLDMSNNRLQTVAPLTFQGARLQHLFLNGNHGLRLGPRSFEGLQVAGLYLHDNSMEGITAAVLAPLNATLQNLWLNGNALQRLEPTLLPVFSGLKHLRLGGNPLDCSCGARGLKKLFDDHPEKFKGASQPTCAAPASLRGSSFAQLTLAQFLCAPPVFTNIGAQLSAQGGALRCAARGDPAPTLYWIPPNGRSRRFPPRDPRTRTSAGVLMLARATPGAHARLPQDEGAYHVPEGVAGMYICVAHNDWGNVTLTFNVTLPRTPPPPEVAQRHPPLEEDVVRRRHHEPRDKESRDRHRDRTRDRQHEPRDRQRESRERQHEPRDRQHESSRDKPHRGKHKHHGRKRPHWEQRTPAGHVIPDGEQVADTPTPDPLADPTWLLEVGRTEKPDPRYNLTGMTLAGAGPTFTLLELVGACAGTFVSTLLLCLIILPLYLRRRWARSPASGLEKPPKADLYLNGLGYLDTPSHTYMDPNELHIHR